MLTRFVRIGVVAVFLTVALAGVASPQPAYAAEGAAVVESIVHEANLTSVVELIQHALVGHQGLSLDDHAVVYGAIGRTNRALDLLYDTGVTGDRFDTAENLLLTQLDLLREVEAATLSEDIDDLNVATVLLVDVAQRRLAFDRQTGNGFTLLAAQHDVNVVDIARDDAATRAAMAELISALSTGRPVGLEISDLVYRALGETSRGLDLVDETFETGDVFNAAVSLLDYRFQFLVNLEQAVISGDLDDLRFVADDWVELSKKQLVFERQLVAREVNRTGRSFLSSRQNSFLSRRSTVRSADISTHETIEVHEEQSETRVVRVEPGDTLSRIADRYGTTVEQIASLNNITRPSLIASGMQLVIPNHAQ